MSGLSGSENLIKYCSYGIISLFALSGVSGVVIWLIFKLIDTCKLIQKAQERRARQKYAIATKINNSLIKLRPGTSEIDIKPPFEDSEIMEDIPASRELNKR